MHIVKNRIRLLLFFGMLFLSWSSGINAQDFINIRKIALSRGDTTVVAGILADVRIEKVHSTGFYHWYSNGSLYHNQGGYSGNLLHGEYAEYGPGGQLILKGFFERGLKTGQWIRWYPDGSMKEVSCFNHGVKEGPATLYSEDGRIIQKVSYRNGQLHGKAETVMNDTLFQVRYKMGTEKKRVPLHVFE